MVEAWNRFKENRLNQGASDTEKLVLNRELIKSGDHEVKILLESQLEISILEKFESLLIQHLRKELDNTKIQIEKEVSDQVVTKNLYTSREKFEYMAQQNPALVEFKERLGLDFDF